MSLGQNPTEAAECFKKANKIAPEICPIPDLKASTAQLPPATKSLTFQGPQSISEPQSVLNLREKHSKELQALFDRQHKEMKALTEHGKLGNTSYRY